MTNTKVQHPEFDVETATANDEHMSPGMAAEVVRQIGWANMMAVSGGRAVRTTHTVILPVSNGFKVVISLAGNDTYTVRRLFVRGTKVFDHGVCTNVYCEELGNAAYYASCFRSYDADEWPHKA